MGNNEKIPKNILDRKVSVFLDTEKKTTNKYITIRELINSIKNDTYKDVIEKGIKELEKDRIKNEYDNDGKLKTLLFKSHKTKNLPLFSLSAHLKKRNAELPLKDVLIAYSGIIQIDIDLDKSGNEKSINELKNEIQNDEHTFFLFKSPSYCGLKIGFVVDVNTTNVDEIKAIHDNSFESLQTYFLNKYNVEIDKKPSNIKSLCFFSYDPDIFVNENAVLFDYNKYRSTNDEKKKIEVSANLQKSKELKNYSQDLLKFKGKVNNDTLENFNNNFDTLGFLINEVGYKIYSNKNGNQVYLTRPEKEIKEGNSAYFYHNNKILTNFSDSVDLPTKNKKNTSYNTFEIVLHYKFNGNYENFGIWLNDNYFKYKIIKNDSGAYQYVNKETGEIIENDSGKDHKVYKLNISIPRKVKEKDNFGNIIEIKKIFSYTFDIPEKLKETIDIKNEETNDIKYSIELPFCFWKENKTTKNNFSLVFDSNLFINFLSEIGFSSLIVDIYSNERIYIHKINKIVIEVDLSFIRNFIHREVLEILPNKISEHFTKHDLKNKFLNGIDSYINDKKFDVLKRDVLNFLHDSANTSYHFFSNGFVEINQNEIHIKDYTELPNYIWRTQIKEHNIVIESDEQKFKNSEWYQWSKNICSKRNTTSEEIKKQTIMLDIIRQFKNDNSKLDNDFLFWCMGNNSKNKKFDLDIVNYYYIDNEAVFNYLFEHDCIEIKKEYDENRWDFWRWCVGKMLHNYKTSSNRKAVILSESYVGEKPQGRTGKGLTVKGISKLRNVLILDGKNMNFNSSFAFQNVKNDTDLIYIDDVIGGKKGRDESKNFNFEMLYSAISEGVSYEGKFKDRVNLSPEESPNFIISTNYTISGDSESNKGRKIDLELHNYYDSHFTPEYDFGGLFFDNWNTEQWNLFYNFMFDCVKYYLSKIKEIPEIDSNTLKEKMLIDKTSRDFAEYMKKNESVVNEWTSKRDFRDKFIKDVYDIENEDEIKKHWISVQHTTKWIRSFAEIYGYELTESNPDNKRQFCLATKK